LRGLPDLERTVRSGRLLAAGEPLAQDGPRLAGLSLLAQAAGEPARALRLARSAAGLEPRSLPAVLVAAAQEAGQGGEPALAPAALEAAAAAVAALVDQHDPALAPAASPGMPAGEREPSVWGLCAAARAADLVQGLAVNSSAQRRAEVVRANARRALAEAEKLARRPGGCEEVLRALGSAGAQQARARLRAAEELRRAGPLGAAALARALARDPDASVRAAASP
jgi:hypothetical protein